MAPNCDVGFKIMTPEGETRFSMKSNELFEIFDEIEDGHGSTGGSSSSSNARASMTMKDWQVFLDALHLYSQLRKQKKQDEQEQHDEKREQEQHHEKREQVHHDEKRKQEQHHEKREQEQHDEKREQEQHELQREQEKHDMHTMDLNSLD